VRSASPLGRWKALMGPARETKPVTLGNSPQSSVGVTPMGDTRALRTLGHMEPARTIETHTSRVFLTDERAYKLKKPVALPFLDYSTGERRRAMCHEELRVNRELAPGVYLGVRGVLPNGDGRLELTDEDDPHAIDYVVEMRRLPVDSTLAAAVERGDAGRADIEAVARRLAHFHAAAPIVSVNATLELRRRLDENADTILHLLGEEADVALAVAVERALAARTRRMRNTIGARAAAGLVRDGHGDLRAEHIVLGETGPLIFDRIEFDPALRQIDVGSDLAFLVMDLHDRGTPELAEALVVAYRAAGGDPGDDTLVALFAAYRAAVRAKVALLGPQGVVAARRLLRLARHLAWSARKPLVVAVCGPSAVGKSHLARTLADASGLPRISSDVTRKRLAGVTPAERGDDDLYSPEATEATYLELGRVGALEVARCGGAVIDATFRSSEQREIFAAGLGDVHADVVFVECRAAPEVLAARSRRRLRDPERESDAGPALALVQFATFEPLDEIPAERHIVLRTERPVWQLVDEIEGILDERAEAP
jgi:aminoglycoside phosphotransferase family enzyme/predicted kinase